MVAAINFNVSLFSLSTRAFGFGMTAFVFVVIVSSVSVSNTSWLEGFDDENGEEMDLEELSKALSEAATSASQSKKPQSKHHSMSNAKPTPVSPRTSTIDYSTPGMVITWIKT